MAQVSQSPVPANQNRPVMSNLNYSPVPNFSPYTPPAVQPNASAVGGGVLVGGKQVLISTTVNGKIAGAPLGAGSFTPIPVQSRGYVGGGSGVAASSSNQPSQPQQSQAQSQQDVSNIQVGVSPGVAQALGAVSQSQANQARAAGEFYSITPSEAGIYATRQDDLRSGKIFGISEGLTNKIATSPDLRSQFGVTEPVPFGSQLFVTVPEKGGSQNVPTGSLTPARGGFTDIIPTSSLDTQRRAQQGEPLAVAEVLGTGAAGYLGGLADAFTPGKSQLGDFIGGIRTNIGNLFGRKEVSAPKTASSSDFIGSFDLNQRMGSLGETAGRVIGFGESELDLVRGLTSGDVGKLGPSITGIAAQVVGPKEIMEAGERFPLKYGRFSIPTEEGSFNVRAISVEVGARGRGPILISKTSDSLIPNLGSPKSIGSPEKPVNIVPTGRGYEPISTPLETKVFESTRGFKGSNLPETETETIRLGIESRRLVGRGTDTLISEKLLADLSKTSSPAEIEALFNYLEPFKEDITLKGSAPQQSQVYSEFTRGFGDIDFDVRGGRGRAEELAIGGAEAMSKAGGREFKSEDYNIVVGGKKAVQFLPGEDQMTAAELEELGISRSKGGFEGFAGFKFKGTQGIDVFGKEFQATTRTGQIGRKSASTFTIQGPISQAPTRNILGIKEGTGLEIGPPGFVKGLKGNAFGRVKDISDTSALLRTEAGELMKSPLTRGRGEKLLQVTEKIEQRFPEIDFRGGQFKIPLGDVISSFRRTRGGRPGGSGIYSSYSYNYPTSRQIESSLGSRGTDSSVSSLGSPSSSRGLSGLSKGGESPYSSPSIPSRGSGTSPFSRGSIPSIPSISVPKIPSIGSPVSPSSPRSPLSPPSPPRVSTPNSPFPYAPTSPPGKGSPFKKLDFPDIFSRGRKPLKREKIKTKRPLIYTPTLTGLFQERTIKSPRQFEFSGAEVRNPISGGAFVSFNKAVGSLFGIGRGKRRRR